MAATSSGRSLTMVEISPRTFCRSAASSSGCRLSIGGSSRTLEIRQPVELGEHVVGQLEGLVVLLGLALAARAQPHDEHDQRDAGRDAAGADHRPHLLAGLGLADGLHLGGGGVGGRGVERHGGHGDRVAARRVQPDGVADQVR